MPDKPKIIIDEDWKAQAQAEKEALQKQAAAKQQAPSDPPTDSPPTDNPPVEPAAAQPALDDFPDDYPELPADFVTHLSFLATQAMLGLGQLPNPLSGKAEPNLKQAKHMIDTLSMLEEKTEGNRTPEESALLNNLLHQLRLAYVAVQQQPTAESPDAGTLG